MCPKAEGQRFHQDKCIQRDCLKCFDTSKIIKEHYNELILVAGQLKYKSWQYQDVTVNVRKNNAFSTEVWRKRVIVECEKPIEEALECLAKAVDEPNIHTNLRKHLFIDDWENKQFEQLKLDIRPGDVLCVMDFAQNYTMINQDAIKSDHYGKQ